MRLIGDVHGKYERYKKIISEVDASIQVGDMGVGFRRVEGPRAGEFLQNPPHAKMVAHKARFIRGNHDNPTECEKHSQWIKDGTVEGDVMLIGGAVSIDKQYRIPDYSWWEDEELSIGELNVLVDAYINAKPRAMITHDCPMEVGEEILRRVYRSGDKLQSRTCQALQSMWSAHSPELWVFGHWHVSFDHVLRGTRFVCLNELEYRDDLL